MEKFNPHDPKYKKSGDLPQNQRDDFTDVEGGFITSQAAKFNERLQEAAEQENNEVPFYRKPFTKKIRASDMAISQAEQDNIAFDQEQKKIKEKEEKIKNLLESKKFIEKIQSQGITAIAEAYQDITERGGPYDYCWERFMEILMTKSAETGTKYPELMDAGADAYIKLDVDFQTWTHTLCHLFEQYGREEGASFLNFPEQFEMVKKLVDETVKRVKEAKEMGNSSRIISPIIYYNLRNLQVENIDGAFPFKPESLSDIELLEIANNESKYTPEIPKFISSKTPREFLHSYIEMGKEIYARDPEKVIALLSAIEHDFPAEKWKEYMEKNYTVNGEPLPLEQIAANFREASNAAEQLEGLYVDVDGTLVTTNGHLNERIFKKIQEAAADGKKVVIFSGADPKRGTDQLRALGVPESFLPVRSKTEYKGRILESLIDDTQPEYQGFKSKDYHPANSI